MHFVPVAVLTFVLTGQAQIPAELVISFTVTDKKGKAIEDVKPEEVSIEENGAKRPPVKLELDRRPLTVALVVDSSMPPGTALQADIVPAVVSFLQKLPPESRFSVWTTSDRPKELVREGTDAKAAEEALKSIAPFGNNAAIDTMVAASQTLGAIEGRRTAVVALTSSSMGDITVDVGAQLGKASPRPIYAVVEVILGGQDARLEDAVKAQTARSGGFHERVFSTMSIATQLGRVIDLLAAQYRAAYAPTVDPRSAKLDVKISRKDARLKMSQRLSTAW